LILEQLFANVKLVVEGSAGVFLEASNDGGEYHRRLYRPRFRGRVYIRPDHYLTIQVVDTGDWLLCEVRRGRRARVVARGQLPSSRYADDRRWDPRR
jgi:hypothetical protein